MCLILNGYRDRGVRTYKYGLTTEYGPGRLCRNVGNKMGPGGCDEMWVTKWDRAVVPKCR